MHPDFPLLIAQFADRQGIVKVLGILGVDGKGEHIAHITTARHLLVGNSWINLLCCAFNVCWVFIRQTIFGKDGVHLCIIVALLTQNIDNLSNRTF